VADVKQKTRTIASRKPATRKFAWALKDSAKFKSLVAELKKHND